MTLTELKVAAIVDHDGVNDSVCDDDNDDIV